MFARIKHTNTIAVMAILVALGSTMAVGTHYASAGQGPGALKQQADRCEGKMQFPMPTSWKLHKELTEDGLSDIQVCLNWEGKQELLAADEQIVVASWIATNAHFHALNQIGQRVVLRGKCPKCRPADTCHGKTLVPMPDTWKTHATLTAKGFTNLRVCIHLGDGVVDLANESEEAVLAVKEANRAHIHYTYKEQEKALRGKDL